MAELIHNVEEVNKIISSIKAENKKYDEEIIEFEELTRRLISKTGFDLIGGVITKQYSGRVNECKETVNTFIMTVRKVQMQLIKSLQNIDDYMEFMKSMEQEEWEMMGYTSETIPVDFATFCDYSTSFGTKTKTLGISFGEGAMKVVGELGDFAFTATGLLTAGVAYAFSGQEASDAVLGSTKAVVVQEYVVPWIDECTDEGVFGNDVKDYKKMDSESYQRTRFIGNEVGHTTAIALTGVSYAPTVAAGAEFGATMEDSWQNGDSTEVALAKSTANASIEYLQWATGTSNKVNHPKESVNNVVTDAAVQAFESFAEPAIDAIGMEGPFPENYLKNFENSGGMDGAVKEIVTSASLSAVGEVTNLATNRDMLNPGPDITGSSTYQGTTRIVENLTDNHYEKTPEQIEYQSLNN